MLAAAAVLVLALAPFTAGPVIVQAAPSPSPGSSSSTAPDLPGSANSSPRDYNGAGWVVAAVVVVATVVGGGTFLLVRSRRVDLSQRRTDRRPGEG